GDITAVFDSQVTRITETTVVLATPTEEVEIPNDFVIIQAGGIPPYEMLKSFGIAFGGDETSIAEQDVRLNLVPA
ncbi:MAG: hypothetical protein D6800_09935, partial [Candidatus Zixiibacteriota bacterium]